MPAPASSLDPSSEYVPDWGRLQFLAPFLRPTPESSADWFTTLKRAGGGCNDLVFSGHMLVAALTAAAFQVSGKRRGCDERASKFMTGTNVNSVLDFLSMYSMDWLTTRSAASI